MSSDLNPYSTPTSNSPLSYAGDAQVYSDGKYLVVPEFAKLPRVYIKTNKELSTGDWRKIKHYAWINRLLYISAIFPILFILISLLLAKRGMIECSLSKSIVRKYYIRRLMAVLAIVILVLVSVFTPFLNDDSSLYIIIFSVLAILIYMITCCTIFRVSKFKYKEKLFYIKGCHPDFLKRFPKIR